MTKRKDHHGDSNNSKRQRYGGSKSASKALQPGMNGIFVSSTRGKERQASREVSGLLIKTIEAMYPDLSEKESDDQPKVAIEDEIAADLDRLANPPPAQIQLDHIALSVDCLFFLHIQPQLASDTIDPVRVVCETIRNIKPHGETELSTGAGTRFASRFIPFQNTCVAQYDEIVQCVVNVFDGCVGEGAQTFAVYVSMREASLDRDDMIAKLATPIIEKGHSVNLSQPQIAIVVEIYRKIAGVCVVTDGMYRKLRKFNVHEVFQKGVQE